MKKLALLLLPALALLLTGCQSDMTPKIVTAPPEPLVCTQWLPISYAGKHDTAETVNQLRRANARRRAYCAGS